MKVLAGNCSHIIVKVFRGEQGNDAQGELQEFTVLSHEPLSVMTLLSMVREQDPSFACRTSTCFKGACGSCLVQVNDRDVFGCTTLIRPGETVVIEPHSRFQAIRDVVVDFSMPIAEKEPD